MKVNHHSLNYKKQQWPNRTYKELKPKYKGQIHNWMFRETCIYYQEHKEIPNAEDRAAIMREVYRRIESRAIWVPFEELCREYDRKLPGYEVQIQKNGISEKLLAPKPPKEKNVAKKTKKTKPHMLRQVEEIEEEWQDDNFFFIAGYTGGGAPFGVTWEEMGLEPWQELDSDR